MGLYDTMQQKGNAITSAVPQVANGGSFAQKQKMQANPVMQGRPAMAQGFGQAQGGAFGQNKVSKQPNAQTGARPLMSAINQAPGQMGSITQNQNQMQKVKNAQAQAPGGSGAIGGSYGQLVDQRP